MKASYLFQAIDAMKLAKTALEKYAVDPYAARCKLADALELATICLQVHSGLHDVEIPIEEKEPPLKPSIPE
jgi:hypothetical protein